MKNSTKNQINSSPIFPTISHHKIYFPLNSNEQLIHRHYHLKRIFNYISISTLLHCSFHPCFPLPIQWHQMNSRLWTKFVHRCFPLLFGQNGHQALGEAAKKICRGFSGSIEWTENFNGWPTSKITNI